ncbi:carbohydrate-binding family 9-like protein [Paenibacillus aurantiacus]|uniref:Carbohydrate-binding family 9-like protein n=1 Tax=Paenibacillus aurantiacus TaxID=1936118 RepID=A0ABV5KVU7_9BACL
MSTTHLPKQYVYRCNKIPARGPQYRSPKSIPWHLFDSVPLVDTVTCAPPLEPTRVSACWDEEFLYFRFVCQDAYMISDFTERDDPLYDQDVVEIFIDETGAGKEYMEIEVSPNNVIFDAMIENGGKGDIVYGNRSWNIDGLETEVAETAGSLRIYDIRIPMAAFRKPAEAGDCWRANFYRIDEQEDGTREYQAWSPTGVVNFHLSQMFGSLQFV